MGACRSFVPTPSRPVSLAPYEGPPISTANGETLKIHGTKLLQTKFNGRRYWWDFIVADVTIPIMGADFLITHRLTVDMANQRLISTMSTPPTPATTTPPPADQPTVSTTTLTSQSPALQKVLDRHREVFSDTLTVRNDLSHVHKAIHQIKTTRTPAPSGQNTDAWTQQNKKWPKKSLRS